MYRARVEWLCIAKISDYGRKFELNLNLYEVVTQIINRNGKSDNSQLDVLHSIKESKKYASSRTVIDKLDTPINTSMEFIYTVKEANNLLKLLESQFIMQNE